ncbi:MAG: DUF3332 domain-containing protein [Bacteroidales bacterium]|nr:DUF3332 domain-containing protein [Bacteroidales bacterium]
MKKVFLSIALASTLLLSSCLGSFRLTNKCYTWNKSIGDKWINELVFIGLNIIPVYDICILADAVIFNSIEFWTGNNPVAKNTEIIDTDNGQYLVETNENGYTITKDGETVQLINENDVWYINQDNQKIELFQFVDDEHILMNLGNNQKVVELSQAGVDDLRAELVK